jgi:hypothetical protein
MISTIINSRNKFVRIFGIKIILIHKDDEIINNKSLMFLSSLIFKINYQEILFINKINYLYKLDNIYFYEDYSIYNVKISPIIISATININKDEIDILNKLSYYSLAVPLFIFLYNEKYYNINNIQFKILKLGKITDIIINYDNISKYKKIYNLLN